MSAGGKLKLAHVIPARKASAVRSQVYRWPRVREAMESALQKIDQEDEVEDDAREDVVLDAPDSDDEDELDAEEEGDHEPEKPLSRRNSW